MKPTTAWRSWPIGHKINQWTVMSSQQGRYLLCQCSCGVVKLVKGWELEKGNSKYCSGCRSSQGRWTASHTMWNHKLQKAVKNAIDRCTNVNYTYYHRYGGRGIKVFEAWLKDRALFHDFLLTLEGHDNPNLLLDRIDNDGHYEPGNLRFITASESVRNSTAKTESYLREKTNVDNAQVRTENPDPTTS